MIFDWFSRLCSWLILKYAFARNIDFLIDLMSCRQLPFLVRITPFFSPSAAAVISMLDIYWYFRFHFSSSFIFAVIIFFFAVNISCIFFDFSSFISFSFRSITADYIITMSFSLISLRCSSFDWFQLLVDVISVAALVWRGFISIAGSLRLMPSMLTPRVIFFDFRCTPFHEICGADFIDLELLFHCSRSFVIFDYALISMLISSSIFSMARLLDFSNIIFFLITDFFILHWYSSEDFASFFFIFQGCIFIIDG